MILADSESVIVGNNSIASNVYFGADNMWSSYDYKAVDKFYTMNFNGETPTVNGVTLSLLDAGQYMDGTPSYNMNPDGVTATLNSCSTSAFGVLGTRVTYDDTQTQGTVTLIGDEALKDCTGITNVAIRREITEIGEDAFNNCTGLKTVSFQDNSSLVVIKEDAFLNCTALHTLQLPSSLTGIGNGAFSDCSSLKRISCLATTAPVLGVGPFYNIAATQINVPASASASYGSTYGGLTVVANLV